MQTTPLDEMIVVTRDVPTRVSDAALVAKRRRKIVKAATALMLRQGYHQTSVREIAAAAELTMGTLYLYISRKEDVLFLISEAIVDELYDGLKDLQPEATARETLRSAVRYFFSAVHRMRPEIRLLYRESASLLPEHLSAMKRSELEERDFFAAIIEDGIRRGEFRQVDASMIGHDIIMLGHMWSLKVWALRDACDYEAYFETQFELILRYLVPGAGER